MKEEKEGKDDEAMHCTQCSEVRLLLSVPCGTGEVGKQSAGNGTAGH